MAKAPKRKSRTRPNPTPTRVAPSARPTKRIAVSRTIGERIDREEKDGTVARDIMATELVNATEDTTIEEALRILVNHKITGLPVLDRGGKMMGVLSEYDILRQLAQVKRIGPADFRKKITFSHKVDSISESTPLTHIMKEFVDTRFRRLPVVDDQGKLVGIITRRDLMRVFYYRAKLD